MVTLRVGEDSGRDNLIRKLVTILYERNDIDFTRGSFRVKGDIVEILPPNENNIAFRVEFEFDTIRRIRTFNIVTGEIVQEFQLVSLFPASHFLTDRNKLEEALKRIKSELEERIAYFKEKGQLLEAERIEQRTNYDIEMLREIGFCNGIENYSRHLSLRGPGETPSVLIDFFPDDFLLVIDESHVTIPQVSMYNGDRSRKQTLVDYGFACLRRLTTARLIFPNFKKD